MQLSLSNMLLVVVVVASIISAAAVAPQILVPREAEVYQLAVYASSKPHAGGVIVDFKIVNVGQRPVELRRVQVDGGLIEITPRQRELMPGDVYEDSILLPALSTGEHSISVEASGGGTPLYESSKFMVRPEANGAVTPHQPITPHQSGSRRCRVEKRPVYEEVKVKDRVWAVIGHEKVPKYETRAKKVCGVVGYRKEPIYREGSKRVWTVVGYKKVPKYKYVERKVCGWSYKKVPVYRTRTVIAGYRWRKVCYGYYGWCFYINKPVYRHERYLAGYRYVRVYSCKTTREKVITGYDEKPVYGWKLEKYRELAGYKSVPIHGCWTEYEKVLVGYEEKPVYGWKEVERVEKRLKGYEEVIVCE